MQAGDVDAVERLWRDKWQALDERGRGAVSFAELPQLLDELGVALTPQELEDAAARIQKWQGSRLLLQGFLRWFLGDGGGDRLLGQQKGDKRKLRAAEAEVAKLRGELDALRKEQADRVVAEARRKGDEAALVARAEAKLAPMPAPKRHAINACGEGATAVVSAITTITSAESISDLTRPKRSPISPAARPPMSSPGPNMETASAVCWLDRFRSCRAPSNAPETAPKSRPHAIPPTPTNKAARSTAASWAAWMPSAVILSPLLCVVLSCF